MRRGKRASPSFSCRSTSALSTLSRAAMRRSSVPSAFFSARSPSSRGAPRCGTRTSTARPARSREPGRERIVVARRHRDEHFGGRGAAVVARVELREETRHHVLVGNLDVREGVLRGADHAAFAHVQHLNLHFARAPREPEDVAILRAVRDDLLARHGVLDRGDAVAQTRRLLEILRLRRRRHPRARTAPPAPPSARARTARCRRAARGTPRASTARRTAPGQRFISCSMQGRPRRA